MKKMTATKRKKVQVALNKCIKEYKNLIRDPRNQYKWENYGTQDFCLICNAMDLDWLDEQGICYGCPLCGNKKKWAPCENKNKELFQMALWYESYEKQTELAIKRLAWIKKTAKKNGWKVV